MTTKFVVIINSLKVPKTKKILLNEISCTKLHLPPEPLTRGLLPPDPHSLCPLSSTEFVETPPEQNSWVCHCIQCTLWDTDSVVLWPCIASRCPWSYLMVPWSVIENTNYYFHGVQCCHLVLLCCVICLISSIFSASAHKSQTVYKVIMLTLLST